MIKLVSAIVMFTLSAVLTVHSMDDDGNDGGSGGGSVTTQPSYPVYEIPGWFGSENQGAGTAMGDINKDGTPDLVVFHIDNPPDENHGYYRVGFDLKEYGTAERWTDPIEIPGWFGSYDQGGSLAFYKDESYSPPQNFLYVFHLDHPPSGNMGYYRIGIIDENGMPMYWTNPTQVPGWFGSENQGCGITVGDINNDKSPDLIVFHIDNPPYENNGYYRIGYGNKQNGRYKISEWGEVREIFGWFGSENQGGGIAIKAIKPYEFEMVVFHFDHRWYGNTGCYRFLNHSTILNMIVPPPSESIPPDLVYPNCELLY